MVNEDITDFAKKQDTRSALECWEYLHSYKRVT